MKKDVFRNYMTNGKDILIQLNKKIEQEKDFLKK